MHTVVMPKMGDTMEEGKILTWLKQEGDTVERGEALAEIETEKVNIEAEAFSAGVLRKILVPAGQTVPVGAPIALTGTADEPLPADVAAPTPSPSPTGRGEPERVPSGTSPASAGAQIRETSDMANGYSASGNGRSQAATATQTAGRVFISPIARRIASEHALDIGHIHGTGPGGRIIREDVEEAVAQQKAPQAMPSMPVMPAQPAMPAAAAAAAAGEEVRAVPLSQMRKTIARRLQQSMQTAPHIYITSAIDATRLGELRASVNEYAATLPQPVKVSINDLIVKGVATALARMPEVNVSFDGEQLLYKTRINVGVAVALEQGLIVPVVRDADKRGVLEIAREAQRLIAAARGGKLKPEEFQGGTFSVSNLGMFDVESFTAVINPPESAILAVGAIVPTPVVRDGQVVVRDIMKVTLSADHRAVDGAVAARFLQELKRLLEQPLGMLV
jgi:pyruvate dehydrogenase E2 component (dihydrolipoyllysine-residue acetyltransferase)